MAPFSFETPEIDSLTALLPAYEFEWLIARGGMGAVFKARQRSLDRDVAIKILPRELGSDPVFRSSFEAEAKAMARLAHPNLIRVYDSGEVGGLLYIVMEYVPGKSLHHSAHGKAIDSRQAVEIMAAACKGLGHAHASGIVHRDIKPANILLTPKREPKIGDFGLARCLRAGTEGPAMGTPAYMAPEVIQHPAGGNPRSDVFALGVVLRELLTGIPAGTASADKAVVSDLKLAAICRKATHPDPALRFPDAASLGESLSRWLGAPGPVPVFRTSQPPHRQPQPAAAIRGGATRGWGWVGKCAVIAFLLVAIHLTWGVYQTKRDHLAMQRQQETAKSEENVLKPFR
jgi:serine/threonine protein kinase